MAKEKEKERRKQKSNKNNPQWIFQRIASLRFSRNLHYFQANIDIGMFSTIDFPSYGTEISSVLVYEASKSLNVLLVTVYILCPELLNPFSTMIRLRRPTNGACVEICILHTGKQLPKRDTKEMLIVVLYHFDNSVASQLCTTKGVLSEKTSSYHYDLLLLGFLVIRYSLIGFLLPMELFHNLQCMHTKTLPCLKHQDYL
ncbi:uncharacterized protein LOC132299692 isoform X2 [Cornus florida]|uniref:uncharacterized protein LOC132299692 isoform X2 n=1 Tax=Cornus florida TaxID=4283 RepID=UPI002897FEBF|nr:uncharacterized protein LOC132299692 isoform X2 [Cornus florida]